MKVKAHIGLLLLLICCRPPEKYLLQRHDSKLSQEGHMMLPFLVKTSSLLVVELGLSRV